MTTFKIIVLSVFGVAIVAAVAIFAMAKSNSTSVSADVVVWGTIPEATFTTTLTNSSLASNKNIRANYIYKDPQDFDRDFVEALAEGKGPDVIILRDDNLYKNRNKLVAIPYKNYSQRTFKDTFIEEGEVFLSDEGVQAIPFIIDPMVMYWNRDLFASNQISQPPKYWEEIPGLISKITRKDASANVLQSALAMGEWRNITNAKEILTTLFFQAGTPITIRSGNEVNSVLSSQLGATRIPGDSAVEFYTQFSNPSSINYTWNRSLPSSFNFFLQGSLAMYFGFASDLISIQQKNSNLNYDVTFIPQVKDSKKRVVYGRMYALAITKQSKQTAAAFMLINALTEKNALTALEKLTELPPVRRDMLAELPDDAYKNVFYNSALISKTFIDPDPSGTGIIFRDMIESITSGKTRIQEAVNRASSQLSSELGK